MRLRSEELWPAEGEITFGGPQSFQWIELPPNSSGRSDEHGCDGVGDEHGCDGVGDEILHPEFDFDHRLSR